MDYLDHGGHIPVGGSVAEVTGDTECRWGYGS